MLGKGGYKEGYDGNSGLKDGAEGWRIGRIFSRITVRFANLLSGFLYYAQEGFPANENF